jgi:hypothetical protein
VGRAPSPAAFDVDFDFAFDFETLAGIRPVVVPDAFSKSKAAGEGARPTLLF